MRFVGQHMGGVSIRTWLVAIMWFAAGWAIGWLVSVGLGAVGW